MNLLAVALYNSGLSITRRSPIYVYIDGYYVDVLLRYNQSYLGLSIGAKETKTGNCHFVFDSKTSMLEQEVEQVKQIILAQCSELSMTSVISKLDEVMR